MRLPVKGFQRGRRVVEQADPLIINKQGIGVNKGPTYLCCSKDCCHDGVVRESVGRSGVVETWGSGVICISKHMNRDQIARPTGSMVPPLSGKAQEGGLIEEA